MSANHSGIRFTDRADDALGRVRTLLVPTELDGAPCIEVARHAAAAAAERRGPTIVLYDRSSETWMDHPHPSGPYRAEELDDEHRRLADELRELDAAGIHALGWISTVPSFRDVITAIQQIPADGVLLPEENCDRRLVDRLTGSRDDYAELTGTIDRNVPRPVAVFVVTDGAVDIYEQTSDDAARERPGATDRARDRSS